MEGLPRLACGQSMRNCLYCSLLPGAQSQWVPPFPRKVVLGYVRKLAEAERASKQLSYMMSESRFLL